MRFVLLGLLALFAVALGDAPASSPSLQDLIKDGQEKFEKALADIRKSAGLKDSYTGDEIVKLVKQRQETLAKDVQDLGKKIEDQIKSNPDANAALNNVKTKLKEAGDKLKKENPEISKNAEKLGESLKSTWDSITQEVEKSYKEFSKKGGRQEELENFLKSIIDKGTAAANELQANINKTLEKKN